MDFWLMWYDNSFTVLLMVIGFLLVLFAQIRINSAYSKYRRIQNYKGLTGYEVAKTILNANGLSDIEVYKTSGNLTDHYDPSKKLIRLSSAIYNGTSIASMAVAAHECGHAVQHQKGYLPLKLRSLLVPAANLGSKLGLPIVILGLILGIGFRLPNGDYFSLAMLGVWIFSLAVLFQIVTLPVEFNASRRALSMLRDYGMLSSDEIGDCRNVLTAAALTYVAAAASSILQLLRLLMLSNRRRDRD